METRTRLYIIVFCIAWSTLVFELLQTRILSALFYNNIVYLTVTIALMGFGISGVLVSIFARQLPDPEKFASMCIGLFAVSSFVCLRITSFLTVLFPFKSTLVILVSGYAVLTIPFIFAGSALGLIFMTYGSNIYRLYFVDLMASACGAFCFTFLLRPLGAAGLTWLVSGVAVCGFILYSFTADLRKFYVIPLVSLFLAGSIFWRSDLINDQPVHYKLAAELKRDNAQLEHSEWTTIAKIDVWSKDERGSKIVTQDGDAPTRMPSPDYSKSYFLDQQSSDYWVRCQRIPYLIRPEPEEVLVIGTGGGLEVLMANTFGAKHITGVEINPATYDLIQGPYRAFLQWPNWENVSFHQAEGRHFVSSTSARYDVISMTGVDTYTALSTGAYVLAENYLYTVEAIEAYLTSLKPNGVMLILRLLYSDKPRESLRLANLFLYAAERLGIENPSQCIMVLAWHQSQPRSWSATLIKQEPFTKEEITTVLDRIKEQEDLAALYIPDILPQAMQNAAEAECFSSFPDSLKKARIAYNRLIRSESVNARRVFEEEYSYKINPVYDDRPFFYEYNKLKDIFNIRTIKNIFKSAELVHYILYFLFALVCLISFLSMILPLQLFEREGLAVQRMWSLLLFFCSLGMGFMFIELGFMQRLSIYLGHPILTLAVVLTGILLFTGIGSYRASKMTLERNQLFKMGMIGTAVASLLWLLSMRYLVPWSLGWPIWIRISIVLLSIFPVGLFMGIPFATGLSYLDKHYPRFIPWAWGINGLTSVMGSVLSIIIAMRIGFTSVIVLGSFIYILGLFSIIYHLRGGTLFFKRT